MQRCLDDSSERRSARPTQRLDGVFRRHFFSSAAARPYLAPSGFPRIRVGSRPDLSGAMSMFTHWAAAPRDPKLPNVVSPRDITLHCRTCSLQERCLSAGLDRGELHQIEALITGRVHVKLEDLARRVVPLQRNLHKIISTEAVRGHNLMLLLGSMRAKRASCGLPASTLAPLC